MLHRSARLFLLAVVLVACRRRSDPLVRGKVLPGLGARVVVLAPHPDDEVLGAAGVIGAAVRGGAAVTVVVATGGEAGRDHSSQRHDLATAREAESRHALAHLGVPAAAVHFLDYADGRLDQAWSEHWTVSRRDGAEVPATAVLEDLRAAMGPTLVTTLVIPAALDEHADHRALNRFALLALLAGREHPNVLGYLIHTGRGWPGRWPDDACVRTAFPWADLVLDETASAAKAALIRDYATQVGPRLLQFARHDEPFTTGLVVAADRPAGPRRPGVRRTPAGVVIHVPRTACVLATDAARLRLRFVTGRGVEERVITLAPTPAVVGGMPGQPLRPLTDLRVGRTPGAIRVALDRRFLDYHGTVLEVLPGPGRPSAPAWLLVW